MSALVAEAADGAETDPESAATPVGSVAKAALANGDGTGDDGAASKVRGCTLGDHGDWLSETLNGPHQTVDPVCNLASLCHDVSGCWPPGLLPTLLT